MKKISLYTRIFQQNSDNFVVAFEALLDNLNVMHHIVVYGCMDEEAAGVPEGVYRCEGADRASCTRILGVWTVGMWSFFFIVVYEVIGFDFNGLE